MTEQVETVPTQAQTEEGMTLMEHLGELRGRLFKAVLALLAGTAVGMVFSERLLQFIIMPYGETLMVTAPTEGITNVFVVSLTLGAALAMPVIVYQILAFVMPGLLPNERKWIYLSVPTATGLFLLGAAFAWFVMLPTAIGFLTNVYPSVFKYDLKPDEYVPFITGVVFWIGVAFEMPLIIFVLAKANVVSARALAKQWRFAIVIVAVIAALITPTPDPINMSIVMTPLLLLYVLSIGMASVARRGKTTPALIDSFEDEDRKKPQGDAAKNGAKNGTKK